MKNKCLVSIILVILLLNVSLISAQELQETNLETQTIQQVSDESPNTFSNNEQLISREQKENPERIAAIDKTISLQTEQTKRTLGVTNGTILNETYYYLNGKLVAMKDSSDNKFYYHSDHLGSTTLVTNQSGDVVEDDVYLPYGAIYNGDGKARFLYTGKEFDAETGMYYYGARYYDPRFMHFVQCDSIKPDIYDPQALNCYAYVLNNPYKYTDPDGNTPVLIIVGAIGAAIATDYAIEIIGGLAAGKSFQSSYGSGAQRASNTLTSAEGNLKTMASIVLPTVSSVLSFAESGKEILSGQTDFSINFDERYQLQNYQRTLDAAAGDQRTNINSGAIAVGDLVKSTLDKVKESLTTTSAKDTSTITPQTTSQNLNRNGLNRKIEIKAKSNEESSKKETNRFINIFRNIIRGHRR